MPRIRHSPAKTQKIDRVRRWIYAYFLLLIFEGMLRKWGSLNFLVSSALLIVRDPVVLMIYFLAWKAGVFPKSKYMKVWAALTVIFCFLGVLQVFFNSWLRLVVVLYGIRTYCLHVPLIFLMPRVFQREDLHRIGRWTLLIAGPMAFLMAAQFLLPPDSFINRGTFGEGSEQIGAALGRIRPAGTFSYGTGATSFNLLVAAFLLYSCVDRTWVSGRIRLVAAVAFVLILPISGSRGFVLSCGILLLFAMIGGTFKPRLLWVTLQGAAFGVAIFALLSLTSVFREGLLTFSTRWVEAIGTGGSFNESIVQRFFGEFIGAFNELGTTPVLGYGLGLGSNVGSALTSWSIGFLLGESEWERTVMEMGPVVAVLWLGARCGFGLLLYRRAWACLRRGQALPWLLLGTLGTAFFNGITQQPTALGFLVFTTGLCLTAIKVARSPQPNAAPPRKKSIRLRRLRPAGGI